jgi:hypothetical protein
LTLRPVDRGIITKINGLSTHSQEEYRQSETILAYYWIRGWRLVEPIVSPQRAPTGNVEAAAHLSMDQLGNDDTLLILFRVTFMTKERGKRLKFWGKMCWNLSLGTLEWSTPQLGKKGFVGYNVRFGGGTQRDKLLVFDLIDEFLDQKMPNGVIRRTQFEKQIGASSFSQGKGPRRNNVPAVELDCILSISEFLY